MRGFLIATILLFACGGSRYRTELVGHGNGVVGLRASHPSGASGASGASGPGVQLPQGNYELAMRFEIPRAQLVDWRITCPGVDLDGRVGETLDAYRLRRSAELTRERDEDQQRGAAAASIVLGAVANANVDVQVAGGPPVPVPATDFGRGTLVASARVITSGDGVCALAVTTEDPTVRASFTITRIRDLEAEDRMRAIAAREVAVKTRGSLSAQLLSTGATHDPARTRAAIRARTEAAATDTREAYLAYLAGKCNAEPGRRARTADTERQRRESRLVAYAEIAQRREQAALVARANLREQLLRWGAKPRPPMPDPKPEQPGPPPFDGAEWTAGYWAWESGAWAWEDGGWGDPAMFDDNVVGLDALGGVATGSPRPEPSVRDHRRIKERVRDHRDLDDPPAWKPEAREVSQVRDHRGNDRGHESRSTNWAPSSKDEGAKVRDHRDDDNKKDDDDKPRVRDHR